LLSVFGIIAVKVNVVELLIPITILITAFFNLFTASQIKRKYKSIFFVTLFFGIIHGLGFSNYFKAILGGSATSKLPLAEFAVGIEAAQIIVVL
jgi:uncharacterized membrane protein